jgi:hypothetical protein
METGIHYTNADANGPAQPSPAPPPDDGVDVTLIRWMLSLSPAERLRVLQSNVRSILRLRRHAIRHTTEPPSADDAHSGNNRK